MTDVARTAGVSLKTVSRVVNGVESVDATLRLRVNEAIDALGYQRNLVAADLRTNQGSRTIGYISTDFTDPFFGAVASAIEYVARHKGYRLLTTSSNEDPHFEQQTALELCRRQVAGLIIVPAGTDQSYLKEEIARGLAVAFVDRPGTGIGADSVLVDNYFYGRQLAKHLVSRGHSHIGILSGSTAIFTHRERLRGLTDELTDSGIHLEPHCIISGISTPQAGDEASRRLLSLQEPPTAIACTNNRLSLGALTAMCLLHRHVELVSFDDFEFSDVLPTEITCVAQDPVAMGTAAAQQLFARIDGDSSQARTLTIPAQVLKRGGLWSASSSSS